tara:strand:+ start:68 stop:409 length:342 start_codon:yes stop_codon:yes gene_type:complete
MQQPSVYDSDPRRAPRQDLSPLLREAEPDASADRNGQGAVEANAPNAEIYLLKIQLEKYRKKTEEMEEDMKAMQQGQEWVHDKVTKHEVALQSERAPRRRRHGRTRRPRRHGG